VKGLEFNHAFVVDADQMTSSEELYVALTRGSKSLIVAGRGRTFSTRRIAPQ
jgi:DNA helicase IV